MFHVKHFYGMIDTWTKETAQICLRSYTKKRNVE